MPYPRLRDLQLKGKKVLLRAGFDVPIEQGRVKDTLRIEAILPTMRFILDTGAVLIIMAHQGRPDGKPAEEDSQYPLIPILENLLGTRVHFASSCIGPEVTTAAQSLKPGEVLLLENLRFHSGEEKNDPTFAKELASLGDVYVNDAFANSHRAHASMVGVPKLLPSAIGLLFEKEIEHLSKVIEDPRRPLTLVLGGAKMETKVPVLEHFLDRGDDILLGGAVANTFIAARGFDVGGSLYEEEQIEKAQELMLESEKEDCAKIHIPRDAVVASEPNETAAKLDLPLEDIVGDMNIYDIGKVTVDRYVQIIRKSGMIVWNGPMGLHEYNRFSHASKRIAEAIAEATDGGAVSIVGGGDTIDFHVRYGYSLDRYTFVSTGGGAMLEYVSGKPLPALQALGNTRK